MITLIVNPIIVELTFTQNEFGTPIVLARDANYTILATISIVHLAEGSKLVMRDGTSTIYESEVVDKSKVSGIDYIFELIEYMLNQINLTHIQRTPKSDNLNSLG